MHACLQGRNAPEHPRGSAAKWREPSVPPLCPGLTGEWLGRENVKHVRTWGRGPLSSPQPFCLSQRPLTDLLCSVHLNSLARRTVQARHLGGGGDER